MCEVLKSFLFVFLYKLLSRVIRTPSAAILIVVHDVRSVIIVVGLFAIIAFLVTTATALGNHDGTGGTLKDAGNPG